MNSESGQVLTWHEDCLQCSVCQLRVSLDNVVFREKLFCKSCYIETNLNRCDNCHKVRRNYQVQSHIIGNSHVSRSSLVKATASEESSGTKSASGVTGVITSSRMESSGSSGRKNSVIFALNLRQILYSNITISLLYFLFFHC